MRLSSTCERSQRGQRLPSAGAPLACAAVAFCAALTACAAPIAEPETLAATELAIVGGTTSTTEQDGAVLISEDGIRSCTGTLIAPNLVLTARHCVSYYNQNN